MFASPLKCCGFLITRNHGVMSVHKNNVQSFTNGRRNYAKSDKDCSSSEVSQTEGKAVEPWPKNDPPPPAWRCQCPQEPQPPNYDPYRIKVPDIVVPPLPPSNAKWTGVTLTTEQPWQHQGSGPYPTGPGSYEQQEQPDLQGQQQPAKEEEVKEGGGFLGLLKGLFGRSKSKAEKGGSDAMMPMLDCTKIKGPCSVLPAPKPPPCPPPPPPPFPWMYVWGVASFFGLTGLIYRLYLWHEDKDYNDSAPIWRPRRNNKRPFHDKDLPACVQYLIVGAGAAGWAAYRAIMEHDQTAKVFIVTKEDCFPYRRQPMSKHMWWNPEPPDLKTLNYVEDQRKKTMYAADCSTFLDPVQFYRKKAGPALSVATGWSVVRVDAENHVAYVKTLSGEQPIYYERCLLAPGSKPKNLNVFKSAPKAVRSRVSTLRTIRDLEIAYRKVKEAKHVVIIGGGCLGCELAWHIGRMNKTVERRTREEPLQVVQIFKDKGVMSSVLPEYLGEWATEKIKGEGVTVVPSSKHVVQQFVVDFMRDTTVMNVVAPWWRTKGCGIGSTQVYDAFESPDGRLELTLSNGKSLITDHVLVAIGTEPRVDMAQPSHLETDEVNGGFIVNTELEARTHLYVAGDAASFYSQWKDTRIRMEHFDNAEEQGYVAGSNMAGYWVPSNMEPHYCVELGDALAMEVVGEVGACMPTVGLFKPCTSEEAAAQPAAVGPDGERPCYKKSAEYQNRYKRGMLFYLRDETVVGMVFWNFPPVEDRKGVATELLRARPSYKDINLLAELLGFPELQCVYIPENELKVAGPCIKNWRVF